MIGTDPPEIAVALGPGQGTMAVAASGSPLARIFVTTNDDATWRRVGPSGSVPTQDSGETLSTGRPALAFDANGILHLAAELYRRRGSATHVDLYYASSPDRGATWTSPVLLDSTGNGLYPKLTVAGDRLFVTWGYRGDSRLHLAWSSDAGRSWTRPREAPGDCINTSDVAVLNGVPFVACAGYAANGEAELASGRLPFTGLRLYRLDLSGDLRLVTTLSTFKGVWPRLLARNTTLVLVADVYRIHGVAGKGWDKCCAVLAHSADGGRTWNEPVDLRRNLTRDDGWDTFFIRTAAIDPRGLLHVIVNGSDQAEPANGAPGTDARLVHVVIEPTSGRLLHEASLTPPVAGPQGYYPGSASLAFHAQSTFVAWISGVELHYTGFELSDRTR